ncbi:hypothetical protein BH09MYX1_BH09MYX1_01110 [soil metagenome]
MVVLLFAWSGCGSAPPDADVPGFCVSERTTHIVIGDVLDQSTEAQFRRTRGTIGSYLVNTFTGGSLGSVTDPGSESFAGSNSDHEAILSTYYSSLGFPNSQLEAVYTSLIAGTKGSPTYFQTVYVRSVQAFHIAGSYLRASCFDDARCIDEYVFWPPIPHATVAAAEEFRSMLSTSDGARYRAALPAPVDGGSVVIHHSEWKVAPTVFVVTFDVEAPNGTLSFDRQGNAVVPPP